VGTPRKKRAALPTHPLRHSFAPVGLALGVRKHHMKKQKPTYTRKGRRIGVHGPGRIRSARAISRADPRGKHFAACAHSDENRFKSVRTGQWAQHGLTVAPKNALGRSFFPLSPFVSSWQSAKFVFAYHYYNPFFFFKLLVTYGVSTFQTPPLTLISFRKT
jgi:hypothetical protein